MFYMKTSLLLLALTSVLSAADPRPAPELVIKSATGQEQLLSKFRGKVVAVEFLLTTCPHCQKASQNSQLGIKKKKEKFGSGDNNKNSGNECQVIIP